MAPINTTGKIIMGIAPIPLILHVLGVPQAFLIPYGLSLLIAFATPFYLVPAAIAATRWHKNRAAILAMNLLLGFTFIGWAGAMIWALTDNTAKPERLDRLA